MREILRKIGTICENHMEKIVLAVAGIISAVLLFTGVIFSPDVVKYKNKNFSPGQIDEQIASDVEKLRERTEQVTNRSDDTTYRPRLTGPVEPNDAVLSVLGSRPQPRSIIALFQSPLEYLGSPPQSVARPSQPVAKANQPRYQLPAIPRLTDVDIGYLRAAAYVPQNEVTSEQAYSSASSSVDDVDMVTVEGKFDIADLYKRFRAYFNGSEVVEAWRDPSLAVPTFAALQLERQEVLDTGLWSGWTAVPPNRVCPYRQLFRVIENVKDLPLGGMTLRMANYNDIYVTRALLQPDPYQIASADEQWYPPSFYGKYKTIQRQIEADEKIKAREEAKTQAGSGAGSTTTGSTTRRGGTEAARGGGTNSTLGGRGSATGGRGNRNENAGGDTSGRGGRGSTTQGRGGTTTDSQNARGSGARATARGTQPGNNPNPQQPYDPRNPQSQGPSVAEVDYNFRLKQIIPTTSLATLKDPLLVWAIDDTVQPGKTYRYQIRIGVFNPVAGTGKVADRDGDKKDQVILWSDFTPVTKSVSVHKKMYFFARDVQDRTKSASIEVARYLRGYWRTEDFQVRPGETIGKEVETKKERTEKTPAGTASRTTNPGVRFEDLAQRGGLAVGLGVDAPKEDDVNPPTIDFSTNTLLVDLVEVNDWTGGPNSRQRSYYDMLYTEDGTRIDHMPSARGWPKSLSDVYQEIKSDILKEKKTLRAFGQTGRGADSMRTNSPYGDAGAPRL
jgi:hypothetical protein